MEILQNIKYDFMGKRKVALVVSTLLIIISLASLFTRGLNFGLDFTGGTVVVVNFEKIVEVSEVRDRLEASGLDKIVVKNFGSARDVEITVPPQSELAGMRAVRWAVGLRALRAGQHRWGHRFRRHRRRAPD